jgi:pSer/pThr/pTyr-binding forkhead associated (FHA) protein
MVDDETNNKDNDGLKRETFWLGDLIGSSAVMPDTEPVSPRPQTGRLAAPWRLLMQIGGQNQTTVGIEVRDQIILGRADPVANFYPDLDLTPYGGQEGGVSRRHAVIIQDHENQTLYLEDLNSVNGTRINGFTLETRRRYRLRDGDEIEVGRLQIVLRFVRSPYA